MPQKCVLVVGGGGNYYKPLRKFGSYSPDMDVLKFSPESVRLVLFTGGSDVSPSVYGEKISRHTGCAPRRDIYEMVAFRNARKLNVPCVGICRGAQFLCAMSGGKLVQHVNGHGGHHMMRTWDDRDIEVSSTHHQMMLPPADAKVLGWAVPRLSNVYVGGDNKAIDPPEYEAEVAFFPNINSLGMQFHPEMMPEDDPCFRHCAELVDQFLLNPAA